MNAARPDDRLAGGGQVAVGLTMRHRRRARSDQHESYRLLLVRRDRINRLRAVRQHEALRKLSFGQGLDWVDTDILRVAGLKVQEAEFLFLFRMLDRGVSMRLLSG